MTNMYPVLTQRTVVNCCIAAYRFFGDKRNVFVDKHGMNHPGFGPTALREVTRIARLYKPQS